MPLDASYAGRTFPAAPAYLVSREKIREFATAVGITDPACHDEAAARALGHRDLVAPPTFPIVLANVGTQAMVADPDLGLDFSRVVHGDQRFRYERPVYAGDVLTAVTTIEEITSRGGHDFLTSRTDLRDEGDDLVVSAWCRLVVRGE